MGSWERKRCAQRDLDDASLPELERELLAAVARRVEDRSVLELANVMHENFVALLWLLPPENRMLRAIEAIHAQSAIGRAHPSPFLINFFFTPPSAVRSRSTPSLSSSTSAAASSSSRMSSLALSCISSSLMMLCVMPQLLQKPFEEPSRRSFWKLRNRWDCPWEQTVKRERERARSVGLFMPTAIRPPHQRLGHCRPPFRADHSPLSARILAPPGGRRTKHGLSALRRVRFPRHAHDR
jgi:hypothetical protein